MAPDATQSGWPAGSGLCADGAGWPGLTARASRARDEGLAGEPGRLKAQRVRPRVDRAGGVPKIAAAGGQVERQLARWVSEARSRRLTWARIGTALGITRQSAWERFSAQE